MKHTINVAILESIKSDIHTIVDLLAMIQRRSDFHEDAANRASRVADMVLSKLETVVPEEKKTNETNNAD